MGDNEDEILEDMDWGDENGQIIQAISDISPATDNIRVAVKIRPPNQRELLGPGKSVCVTVPGKTVEEGRVSVSVNDIARTTDKSKDFTFDYAFSPMNTQLDVFNAIGVDMVQCAHHGYNGDININ
jgi:hypothetical protein